jgi:hypothetical protein
LAETVEDTGVLAMRVVDTSTDVAAERWIQDLECLSPFSSLADLEDLEARVPPMLRNSAAHVSLHITISDRRRSCGMFSGFGTMSSSRLAVAQ